MNDKGEQLSALGHLRVLDLSDEKGAYCAKLLADLGADTIKVESPQGDPTRSFGPFLNDVPHPERSLFFFYYNTNKRGITLNIQHPEGQNLLKKLVKTADVVVESFPPGYLAKLGLAFEDLMRINSGLVMASITTFGQYGPHAWFKGSDTIAWAMSGYGAIMGYEDPGLPPVNAPGLQCCHVAGYYAATGILAAIYYRSLSGRGQHIDTSMQEAMATMVETPNVYYSQDGILMKRFWGYTGDPTERRIFRSKDGYVDLFTGLGRRERERWTGLVEWMKSEGMAGDLEDEQWFDREYAVAHRNRAYQQIEAWTMTHTGRELFESGQARRQEAAPVNEMPQVLEDPQLRSRGFFVEVEHPEIGGSFAYPGAPYDLQKTPWSIRRRAPLIGEHNSEIYEKELGLSPERIKELQAMGVI